MQEGKNQVQNCHCCMYTNKIRQKKNYLRNKALNRSSQPTNYKGSSYLQHHQIINIYYHIEREKLTQNACRKLGWKVLPHLTYRLDNNLGKINTRLQEFKNQVQNSHYYMCTIKIRQKHVIS